MLTRPIACPPTCDEAVAVLVSDTYAKRHGLRREVTIAAQAMRPDRADSPGSHDMMQVVGYGLTQAAARAVYGAAGIGPEDLDVVELHDCFG